MLWYHYCSFWNHWRYRLTVVGTTALSLYSANCVSVTHDDDDDDDDDEPIGSRYIGLYISAIVDTLFQFVSIPDPCMHTTAGEADYT